MTMTRTAVLAAVLGSAAAAGVHAIGDDRFERPRADSWSTYYGDYSGRRYSLLKQIDVSNVKGLALSWIYRATLSSSFTSAASRSSARFRSSTSTWNDTWRTTLPCASRTGTHRARVHR